MSFILVVLRLITETLLPMMFLGLRKLGNICCGHKMFLNKIRNTFCVPETKFVSATNVARRAYGETFVSATLCPQQCVLVCQGLKDRVQYTIFFFEPIVSAPKQNPIKLHSTVENCCNFARFTVLVFCKIFVFHAKQWQNSFPVFRRFAMFSLSHGKSVELFLR